MKRSLILLLSFISLITFTSCSPETEDSSQESGEKTSIVSDRCQLSISPIGQALAPYLPAGCCAVTGLVPHALFMVCKLMIA